MMLTGEEKKQYYRNYYIKNKLKTREANYKWRKENKNKYSVIRFKANVRRYNLSLDEYYIMVEKQEGKCAICKEKKKLSIDHDHTTKLVRGLLCKYCNILITIVENKEKLAAAKSYLTAPTWYWHQFSDLNLLEELK